MTAIVVGAGLFGWSIARHLQDRGVTVTLVGPDRTHPMGQSSHDDAGRVLRHIGKDPVWTALHGATLAGLADLRARTGVNMMTACGSLFVADRPGHPYVQQAREQARALGIDVSPISTAYRFERVADALYEGPPSGIVKPPILKAAQHMAFTAAGGRWLPTLVHAVDGRRVHTPEGLLEADVVIVSVGSFTNSLHDLPVVVESESILLAEVPAGAYPDLPCLLWEVDRDHYEGVYIVPPLVYPDGRTYVKIGANLPSDQHFETAYAGRAWFDEVPGPNAHAALLSALTSVLPDLPEGRRFTRPCIITRTTTGRPYLEEVDRGLWVATGGNGYGAMSSDGFGALTANVVTRSDWGPLQLGDCAIPRR